MGMMGINDPNRKTITLKRTDGTVVGTVSVAKSSKKKTKKLQYQYTQISDRVLRTKNSMSARTVVTSARSQVAVLYRKQATGDYDENEIRHAIAHAESLVRVAKKKVCHLEQEEKIARDNRAAQTEELLEGKEEEPSAEEIVRQGKKAARMQEEELNKLMKELQEAMKEMERMQELQEAAEAMEEGDMSPEDLELLKKKHRASEMREMLEADLKYLKALFDKLAKDKEEASGSIGSSASGFDGGVNGVALELGGAEIDVPAAELVEMSQGGSIDVQA